MVRRVRGDAAGVTPFRNRLYAVRLLRYFASDENTRVYLDNNLERLEGLNAHMLYKSSKV